MTWYMYMDVDWSYFNNHVNKLVREEAQSTHYLCVVKDAKI